MGELNPIRAAKALLQTPARNRLSTYLGGYPDAAVTPHDIYYYSTCYVLCQVKSLLSEEQVGDAPTLLLSRMARFVLLASSVPHRQ